MKKYYALYIAVCIAYTLTTGASDAPKKDLFDQLSQQAEQQYKKSSDQSECSKTKEIKKEPMTYDNLTAEQNQQLRNITVKPSIFFSSYNCRKLLKANPLWQQIKDEISQEDKNKLFCKLLSDYNRSESVKETFPLACAVCAGANPDQKPEGYGNKYSMMREHYALWFACDRKHKAFFDFLVKQGANLDLSCHGISDRECAQNKEWSIPFRWSSKK